MGMFDSIVGRVQSDLTYKAGSEITSAITGAAKKGAGRDATPKCPKCKKPLQDVSVAFCPECGAKLHVICEKCTKEYPVGTKFCTQCGEKLK